MIFLFTVVLISSIINMKTIILLNLIQYKSIIYTNHKLLNFAQHENTDEKKQLEAYHNLVRLFELPQLDNVRILRHLIYMKDDLLPLVDGTTKSKVNSHTPFPLYRF